MDGPPYFLVLQCQGEKPMQVLVWLDSTGYCVLSFARASGVKT